MFSNCEICEIGIRYIVRLIKYFQFQTGSKAELAKLKLRLNHLTKVSKLQDQENMYKFIHSQIYVYKCTDAFVE